MNMAESEKPGTGPVVVGKDTSLFQRYGNLAGVPSLPVVCATARALHGKRVWVAEWLH